MTGSPKNRRRSHDGPPPSGPDNCDQLVVSTVLNSPVARVVASLKKGDALTVVARKTASISRLEAVTKDGKVAGALTPPELLAIVDCIEKGHEYEALLLNDPSGGSVKIRIQSASKS